MKQKNLISALSINSKIFSKCLANCEYLENRVFQLIRMFYLWLFAICHAVFSSPVVWWLHLNYSSSWEVVRQTSLHLPWLSLGSPALRRQYMGKYWLAESYRGSLIQAPFSHAGGCTSAVKCLAMGLGGKVSVPPTQPFLGVSFIYLRCWFSYT